MKRLICGCAALTLFGAVRVADAQAGDDVGEKSVGLGVVWQLHQTGAVHGATLGTVQGATLGIAQSVEGFLVPDGASARFRLSPRLTVEPVVGLHYSRSVGNSAQRLSAGVNARVEVARRGRVSLLVLGGVELSRAGQTCDVCMTSTSQLAASGQWGVSMQWDIRNRWSVTADGWNSLFGLSKSSFESPAGDDGNTAGSASLSFEPTLSMGLHAFF